MAGLQWIVVAPRLRSRAPPEVLCRQHKISLCSTRKLQTNRMSRKPLPKLQKLMLDHTALAMRNAESGNDQLKNAFTNTR